MKKSIPPAPEYDNFSIVIDDNLEMPSDVLGEIWIWTPEFEFPERGWNDLAAQVTQSFLDECYMLLGGRERSSIWFMRGPMQVDIERANEETWIVEGVWRNASRTPPVSVRAQLMVTQTLDAGELIMAQCKRQGWRPKSVVDLEVALARLKREASYRLGM